MDLIRDKKFISMLILFVLILAGLVVYPTFSGMFLILSLIIFGTLCLFWKESNIKLAGLAFLLLLAIANIGANGLNYGIDFDGGTRIPVILEQPVGTEEMNELVQGIKKRVSVLGLSEAKVRAIGDNQINVEVPFSDEETISFIEDTISHQGVYWGIIDGQIAVSGEDIYSTSIRPLGPNELAGSGGAADWGVGFTVNRQGAQRFADVAKGKADYPVYMFLDRPEDAVLFISRAQLTENMLNDSSERESLKALKEALELDGNRNISIYLIEDVDVSLIPTPKSDKTWAIIPTSASDSMKNALNATGYVIKNYSDSEMTPQYSRTRASVLVVNQLESVGLLSSPILSAGLASGTPNYGFSVTGTVKETGAAKQQAAINEVKRIESILKGGSLPVQISLGSRTTLPPSLGQEFLRLSLIGIAGALVAISILIGVRYRNIKATLPIVAISITELIILLSILGSFTIDLAAMAGIIAAIGVGVDAQIVITDEILKRSEEDTDERIGHAFAIIKTNVIVASLSMLPLLFSGLVEIIGFAISTILGSLLGYLLSRPAYAAMVGMIVSKEARH
jgi:preprotein translocase subunit SecD